MEGPASLIDVVQARSFSLMELVKDANPTPESRLVECAELTHASVINLLTSMEPAAAAQSVMSSSSSNASDGTAKETRLLALLETAKLVVLIPQSPSPPTAASDKAAVWPSTPLLTEAAAHAVRTWLPLLMEEVAFSTLLLLAHRDKST